MTERQAYEAGLVRFTVIDKGKLAATRIRCRVVDGADDRTVFVGTWHDAYRERRLRAAMHAAEMLSCSDRLDTDMSRSPIDQTWISRLRAARSE